MAWIDSPQLGTAVFVLIALWNGVGLSVERTRPLNAIIGLLLTVCAALAVYARPVNITGLLMRIPYLVSITGQPAIDAFLLAALAFASIWTLVELARHELLRDEHSQLAAAASALNRGCLALFSIGGGAYLAALLLGWVRL